MATEVTLDAQSEAHFPDRCILCGCTGPGEWVEEPVRAQFDLRGLFCGGTPTFSIRAPACTHCRKLLVRQRDLRNRGSIVALAVTVIGYASLVLLYGGPHANFIRTAALVLFLAPYVIWEGLFPMPLRLRGCSRRLTYVFEHGDYGREFALMNPHARDFYDGEAEEFA